MSDLRLLKFKKERVSTHTRAAMFDLAISRLCGHPIIDTDKRSSKGAKKTAKPIISTTGNPLKLKLSNKISV